jgi:lipopolysaccharide transport protein LptA
MKSMKTTLILILPALLFSPCNAAPLNESDFEMINISADEAFEDERPGILHFNGRFLMQSSDWQLTSSQATVYGSPNRPDRVELEGSPARFLIDPAGRAGKGPVEATALVVEYLRETNKLKLTGNAMLVLDNEVVRSTSIEYDIGTNRYQAGGVDGVQIEVLTTD